MTNDFVKQLVREIREAEDHIEKTKKKTKVRKMKLGLKGVTDMWLKGSVENGGKD